MKKQKLILGAGGTGRTIAGVIFLEKDRLGFLDDAHIDQTINEIPVIGPLSYLKEDSILTQHELIVGFGCTFMAQRQEVYEELISRGGRFFNAFHPNVYLDSTAEIGHGVLLASNCSVMPNAKVGNNCIICAHSSIDHDVNIGSNSYISPGVNLAGGSKVGMGTLIGMNASVLPGVSVGSGAIVGAGSVVREDVPDDATVAGVPARIIK